MNKKRPTNDAGTRYERRYYDPERNRGRVKLIGVIRHEDRIIGPVTGSRQHRRARARLPFEAQRKLAASMGFPTPTPGTIGEKIATEAEWIAAWEEAYDRLAKKGIL